MAATEPINDSEIARIFANCGEPASLALAVSGGADSVALMRLAARWRSQVAKGYPTISVLTVDHALRPESAGEANRVAALARSLGFRHATLKWTEGRPSRINQESARRARYELMARYCHGNHIRHLATAHHLDDQAETLLMRLARGSGIDGLAAIPRQSLWAGVTIIRPLLDLPKSRLIDYLKAEGQGWLEDPSNRSPRYERNRVRQAMAELARLGFSAEKLALTAKRMRRAQAALESATDDYLKRCLMLHRAGYCTLEDAQLKSVPAEIVVRALRRTLMAIGGKLEPPRLAKLERLTEKILHSDSLTATLAGCRINSNGSTIQFSREKGRLGYPEFVLSPGRSGLWDCRFHVAIDPRAGRALRVRALGEENYASLSRQRDRKLALPGAIGGGLVSFWNGERLMSVPQLGLHADPDGSTPRLGPANRPLCRADFANAAILVGEPSFSVI